MLCAAMLAEQHIKVTCHVTGGVDIGLVGLQAIIHYHAVRHFNSTVD